MNNQYVIIGIDGGATKVSGWIVNRDEEDDSFTLGENHAECAYADISGYLFDFKPVPIPQQLEDFRNNKKTVTSSEAVQGKTYTEACARVIIQLAEEMETDRVLVGIGMPGLKTEDRQGIAVLANGPRIFNYAVEVESLVKNQNKHFVKPISHIGSDADYCGIGEKYARNGSLKNIQNAYYLGGGTGTADALLLYEKLVPFDQTKKWLAKTWEMKNDLGKSLEKYASASGIQFLYSQHSGISVESLNRDKIYPLDIANRALSGDKEAIATMDELNEYLALLLYERITTLFSGSHHLFQFINEQREPLETEHPYKGVLLDRVVIGQRLGDLLGSRAGFEVLTKPLVRRLSGLIHNSEYLTDQAKAHYLHGNQLKDEILFFSPLREAPALGAGIDAYLSLK
jgi:predicted NBD/HSP70 family sugar kinase